MRTVEIDIYWHEEAAYLGEGQGDAGVGLGRRGVRRDFNVELVIEVFVARLQRVSILLLLFNSAIKR